MTRVLVVVRHAKAESFGPSDHERALTERGVQQAAATGTWLAARGIVPQRALVSDAVRTRLTWAALAEAAGWAVEARFEGALYEADVESALDLVRALDDETTTALVLGHNPTVAYLAQVLDAAGAPELASTGFRPSSVAVLEHDGPWADLVEGAARLVDLYVPQD